MSITPTLFQKLERCQSWFLKNVFSVTEYAPSIFLLNLSGINSIESEVHVKRLLLLGRLITEPKIAPAVKEIPFSALVTRWTFIGKTGSFRKLSITFTHPV